MDYVARSRNRLLERLGWGSFLIGLGCLYLCKDYYDLNFWALSFLLAGGILLMMNIARAWWKMKIAKGSLGIGSILVIVGAATLRGIKLNWIALAFLLIGIWIILDALTKR